MKILIIEDEYNLADAIASLLRSEKYQVDIQTDGEEGFYAAIVGAYDLIILDVMLPNKSGFDILRDLRDKPIESKILMLTAKSSIEDKMAGFNGGADDYLTKPFHMNELLARVNVQLRKNTGKQKNYIECGDLRLDINKMELRNTITGQSVNVLEKEFQMLELFLSHPNQVLPKERIFNKIWGFDSDRSINNLEAYVSFIRKKLALIKSSAAIKTCKGIGYKLELPK